MNNDENQNQPTQNTQTAVPDLRVTNEEFISMRSSNPPQKPARNTPNLVKIIGISIFVVLLAGVGVFALLQILNKNDQPVAVETSDAKDDVNKRASNEANEDVSDNTLNIEDIKPSPISDVANERLVINQRDNNRRFAVSELASIVTSYMSNNRGRLPTQEVIASSDFIDTYYDGEAPEYSLVYDSTDDSTSAINFHPKVRCDGSAGSARIYSVSIKLERGEVYCLDN